MGRSAWAGARAGTARHLRDGWPPSSNGESAVPSQPDLFWDPGQSRTGPGTGYNAPTVRVPQDRWPATRDDRRPQPTRRGRLDANRWHWLLLVPIVIPLLTPIYNRTEPTLGGVPFFYWGQLLFAVLASAVVTIVHVATRGR